MGVMEIGLKCAGKDGVEIFGIGRIDAAFHWRGTMKDDSDRFIISANGSARIGAPIRKNQAGMLSSPVAVGCSVSRTLNIRHSEIGIVVSG